MGEGVRTQEDKDKDMELCGRCLERIYDKCVQILTKNPNEFLMTVGGDHSIATATIA